MRPSIGTNAATMLRALSADALANRRVALRRKIPRSQIPLEKRPGALPGIDLLGRVVTLEGLRIDAPAEGMAAARRSGSIRRIDVDLGLGEIGLQRPQRIDHLLIQIGRA